MSKSSISVVIPNYNGKSLLESNLPFLYSALKKANVEYEVIIPDDCSTDDSVIFLKKNYPGIIIIGSKINCGFSPNINKGIFAASKDLVFALNSDVQLTENYFSPLLKYFSKENTFGVMGRIIGMNDDKIQDSAKYPEKKGAKIKTVQNYLIKDYKIDFWTPTLFLSGANALIDRQKLLELKGFDEIYAPFYVEDVDLSLRAWRLGWKCYYEHNSVCRHPVSATIENYHKKKKIRTISLKNQFIFHAIHLNGKDLLLWKIQTLITLIFSWFPLERSNFKAYKEFIKKESEIKISKKNMELLFIKHQSKLEVKDVIKAIKSSLKNLKIIKF